MLGNPWPVNWSASWVGALASFAAALVLGLIASAAGATTPHPFESFHKVAVLDLIGVVCASFFGGAAGGWAAGKIAGFRTAEPSILHAAIAWAIALPILLAALASGSTEGFGGWYGGLHAAAGATPLSPDATRATALAALTSVLISLVGAVIGGWLSCGEPMTIAHHRSRTTVITDMERRAS